MRRNKLKAVTDFPHPDSPTRASTRPFSRSKETPSTATTGPPFVGTSTPSKKTRPSVGSSSKLIVRSRVDFPHPDRMATPLEIMIEGPIGGAAFNNEFGRPNLCGYFRTFEWRSADLPANEMRGYHKPIMIAGGVGNVREEHAKKTDVPLGARVVTIGGPAMLIGLGGGAASSVASGTSSVDLDFASVQRGNPEMQRRAQEVIDRCWAMGDDNPILLIHDVGAGGLSNAVPEAVDHSKHGARIELRDMANAEPGMSPMGIWCNEAQERYVLIVAADRCDEFESMCERERCPVYIIGTLTDDGRLVV